MECFELVSFAVSELEKRHQGNPYIWEVYTRWKLLKMKYISDVMIQVTLWNHHPPSNQIMIAKVRLQKLQDGSFRSRKVRNAIDMMDLKQYSREGWFEGRSFEMCPKKWNVFRPCYTLADSTLHLDGCRNIGFVEAPIKGNFMNYLCPVCHARVDCKFKFRK